MEASSPPPRPPEEPPEVTDASTLGGWVWVVLFGLVMGLSVLANLVFIVSVLRVQKKRTKIVYLLLIVLFAVNLVDYALLIFDFSLGLDHVYPHGQGACKAYQIVSKGNPIVQAAVIVVLVFYAMANYASAANHRGCSRPIIFLGLFLGILSLLYGLLALPTAAFADIVNVEGKRYCEIDAGGQKAISIYYLVYSALLSYWLPLLLSIMPMIRLAKVSNSDKYPEVTVVLATASSFFLFYSLHGCLVLVRHTMDAMGIILDAHHSWMIKVAQSLLWLIAYFWHVTRPLLAFLMDADLKAEGCGQAASSNAANASYDLVEGVHKHPKNNRPLKVILSKSMDGVQEEEMTRLNNQDEEEGKICNEEGEDQKTAAV